MLETSWKMVSLTVPVSLIWGLTLRVRPTSLRSMVWKGLTAPVAVLLLVYCPVKNGTFCPTTILASSLSRVSKLGVERMLASVLVCKKFAKLLSTLVPLMLRTVPMFKPLEMPAVAAAVPPCSLASASGTTLNKPWVSTTAKPCKRSAAKNWVQASAGETGSSVLRLSVPLTRGSTTRFLLDKVASVRATLSMSALTKFRVMGCAAAALAAGPAACAKPTPTPMAGSSPKLKARLSAQCTALGG